jgi:hypothetical protein
MKIERKQDLLNLSQSGLSLPPSYENEKWRVENPEVRFFSPGSKCFISEVVGTNSHTIVKMVHYSDPLYVNGGWVRIHPEMFIRPSFTEGKFPLIRAVNIPIFPEQYHYEETNQSLSFLLIFPKLPDDVISFDLIEKEPSNDTFFNFYGIKLRSNK